MSLWKYLMQIRFNKKQKLLVYSIGLLLLITVLAVPTGVMISKNSKKAGRENGADEDKIVIDIPEPEKQDPQVSVLENEEREEGSSVDIEEIVEIERPKATALGIDVSRYQGNIDWKKVADSGIDFAMIRVGYRTTGSGTITADSHAKYNMQQADKYGVKVGVYFFSTAISEEEARAEANWVAQYISTYNITYPVAYDCEGFTNSRNRHYGIGFDTRTDHAIAFMECIKQHGYTPLFYGSKSDMEDEPEWDMDRISSLYKVWVAQYPSKPYPETQYSSYSGRHTMWQYTNKGSVPGIGTRVDMNVGYLEEVNAGNGQEGNTNHEEDVPDEQAPAFNMTFTSVNEQVTAKQETNLRDIPSQGADSKVMYSLKNGEVATRTGVSSSGWSRVVYNGNTYYAVSSLLTTDLTYKPPQPEDDGIKTQFSEVNEQVTAKQEINLRKKPSVDDEIAPVVVKITNGEIITRTGINTEVGWSRVIWQGQTLYCVSQYLQVVE